MRKALTVGSLILGRQASPAPAPSQQPRQSNRKTPTQTLIRFQQNGTEFSVRPVPRQLLLDTALAQLQPVAYKCRKGSCGKCTVQIQAGSHLLQSPTRAEQEKLDEALKQGYRLACQACIVNR